MHEKLTLSTVVTVRDANDADAVRITSDGHGRATFTPIPAAGSVLIEALRAALDALETAHAAMPHEHAPEPAPADEPAAEPVAPVDPVDPVVPAEPA